MCSLIHAAKFRNRQECQGFCRTKAAHAVKAFFVVFALLAGVIFYEVINHHITGSTSVGCMMLGMLLGAMFVRRKRIYWEEETSRVIARMDRAGLILLVLYLVLGIIRHFLLDHLFHGRQLIGISLSIAAGTMLGRLLSMRSQIRQILKGKNII